MITPTVNLNCQLEELVDIPTEWILDHFFTDQAFYVVNDVRRIDEVGRTVNQTLYRPARVFSNAIDRAVVSGANAIYCLMRDPADPHHQRFFGVDHYGEMRERIGREAIDAMFQAKRHISDGARYAEGGSW